MTAQIKTPNSAQQNGAGHDQKIQPLRQRLEDGQHVLSRIHHNQVSEIFSAADGFAGLAVAEVHVQPLHPVTERMAGELKRFGGACQAEIILLQRAGDEFAFDARERVVQRFVRARPATGALFCRRDFDLKIRQAGGLDFARGFQNQRAFDDVAEFAHVARPAVRKQFLPRGGGEAADIFVHRGAEQFQKMFGQQQNILAAFAQRRQVELHDVQAVEQIFAELVGGDGLRRCRGWSRR